MDIGFRLSRDDRFIFCTLSHVFKYLSARDLVNCSLVCPLWKWIAQDPLLWKNVKTVYGCQKHLLDVFKCHSGDTTELMIEGIYGKNRYVEILGSHDITTVKKIALTYCHFDAVEVIARAKPDVVEMHLQFMDEFLRGPKVLTKLGLFSKLTHLEIVEFSPNRCLENADFLKSLYKLKHLALWTNCEKQVWYDVAEQSTLQSLNLYAGDTNCIQVLFAEERILKITELKRLQITNTQYQLYAREYFLKRDPLPFKMIRDHYTYTVRKPPYDCYYADQNITILKVLAELGERILNFTWYIEDSPDRMMSVPRREYFELLREEDVMEISDWHIQYAKGMESVSIRSLTEVVEDLLWEATVIIKHINQLEEVKPKCMMCDNSKNVPYRKFFSQFFKTFS